MDIQHTKPGTSSHRCLEKDTEVYKFVQVRPASARVETKQTAVDKLPRQEARVD